MGERLGAGETWGMGDLGHGSVLFLLIEWFSFRAVISFFILKNMNINTDTDIKYRVKEALFKYYERYWVRELIGIAFSGVER